MGKGPQKYGRDSIVTQVVTMRDDLWAQNPSRSDVWKALMCRGEGECTDPIDFIVFAGGMGGSEYVQERLQEELGVGGVIMKVNAKRPSDEVTRHTELIFHPEAQLCVARGLVRSRMAEVSPDSGSRYQGTIISRSKR